MCDTDMVPDPASFFERLVNELLNSNWENLHAPNALQHKRFLYPGVYVIAYSDADLSGTTVQEQDVIYVGQSTSKGGVRKRLNQFKKRIEGNPNAKHSGANKFYHEILMTVPFGQKPDSSKRLFYAVKSIECNSDNMIATPDDFRKMGHVLALEYYVIARVLEKKERRKLLNKF